MADDPLALGDHLQAATTRLIGRAVGASDRFGIAVSGGPDSMALLALAARQWPGQVAAATVDHGLRPQARAEAEMVAHWCAVHEIAHVTLRPGNPIGGNLQAEGRRVRYALLEDWRIAQGLDWLLTAHQADDQIETVLMRLNRGAGVSGLAAIRSRRGVLLRPLLAVRRADLRAWCKAQDVPFIDDPSNADPRFDRARLRQRIDALDLVDPAHLNRSVEALSEADAALDWMTERLAAEHVRADEDGVVLTRTDLPSALLRRLLQLMIRTVHAQAEAPRGPAMDQALVQLFDGRTVALADCIVTGGARWSVRRAPPRRAG